MPEIHLNLRETHVVGQRTRESIISERLCAGLARRGIFLAGLSDARPPFAFQRRTPRFTQLLVCLSGAGEVQIEGRWSACGPGMAYLSPPGVPHAYRALDGSTPWRVAWVQYLASGPASAGGRHGPTPPLAGAERPLLTAVNPQPFAATLRGLYEEYSAAAPDIAILEEWVALLDAQARRIARTVAADAGDRLRPLWEAVTAEPGHPWTVEALAARAGLSGEQLRRLCHRDLGRSPMRQVAHLRMRHAASLLATGGYTVEAAAEAVGYENAFAFSTAFKRSLGQPPSCFRPERRAAGYNEANADAETSLV